MRKLPIFMMVIMTLILLLACSPTAPQPTSTPSQLPATLPPTAVSSKAQLTPNPVETSIPIYGSVLKFGLSIPRSFDGHQAVAWGAMGTLPTFNQLVMFDINYKECVPENIIGDLADSWETSPDGAEITFYLHQGVKWHDGVPFTADDVIYSLDKMTDFKRSAISDMFPAYQSTEKIDDNTVKIHLKYASAGFMIALASGEAVIQAKHLAGTSDQSAEFMIGTGPFILEEYLPRVDLKWQRNPDYWKKDKYGNQLPYLDGIIFYQADGATTSDMLIARRLDLRSPTTGAATIDTYEYLKAGAPDLLWQKRDKDWSYVMFLNLSKAPLDDIRVRRAMALLINEEDLITGCTGDAKFGITDIGLFTRSFGLPAEEIRQLMGWDNKSMVERITEAQQLMTEAGYPDGFKLNLLTRYGTRNAAGITLVFNETLHKYLKIDGEVNALQSIEMYNDVENDNYDLFTTELDTGQDLLTSAMYFITGGYANYSHYSNPEVDKMMAELDHITDPIKRREVVWAIERNLLTDLPILPTGTFIPNYMPYYPHVKNLRFTEMSSSAINRLEDVWIDESLRVK